MIIEMITTLCTENMIYINILTPNITKVAKANPATVAWLPTKKQ